MLHSIIIHNDVMKIDVYRNKQWLDLFSDFSTPEIVMNQNCLFFSDEKGGLPAQRNEMYLFTRVL